ncbi:hypothetical protein M408DRAFT_62367 [Serendipita vermifera MAFF 305830]|uniref:DUF6533 domain-containing protein n=1 Tax=Serendipita vermifera MAFF 305830 TaxID=933852 RepID=A0A0C3BNS8_SERVB|nr:hypothetical protein M408DRAFT_62367 [Serendipita vermifera MAFF 305830]
MALSFLDNIDHSDLLPTFNSIREALDYLTISAVNVYASKYLSYATFALLIYDHLLTLPEEVKLVWLGRPSFVKALFLFNRYFVPLFIAIDLATLSGSLHMTDQVSKVFVHWQTCLTEPNTVMSCMASR